MNWVNRFMYFFTPLFWKLFFGRLKDFYTGLSEKRISLAVVGTPSSGKSFLLMDIIDSLESMGDTSYPLERNGFRYQDINDYTPDELGGHGRTIFYACRQSNHYGANMVYVGDSKKEYNLDFLNIPGEAFVNPPMDDNNPNMRISRVGAYNKLKEKLENSRKLFVVTNYVEKDTGDIIKIVEPYKSRPLSSGYTDASPSEIDDDVRRTRFLKWDEIARELQDYEPVKGSTRKMSGKKLLKRFFEYNTDSIIRSITDLIKDGDLKDMGFDDVDFEAKEYDKAFVFMHYCSRATDIVLCNRIFMPQSDDNTKDIPFGELAEGIAQFIEKNNKTVRAYLAFRNVDFMLYEKEKEYMRLDSDVLKGLSVEERRNAIYSIFHSSMLYHVNNGLLSNNDEYDYLIGLDGYGKFEKKELLDGEEVTGDFIKQVAEKYVDFDGGDGVIAEDADDLAGHIKSRLGGLGSGDAFRGLLKKTGIDARNDMIVPHVYFTCTPITCEYEIYRNFNDENGNTASDFVRKEGKSKELFFRKQNSHVCFGSYQLCMDIIKHHGLKQFTHGSLLRHLQGLDR